MNIKISRKQLAYVASMLVYKNEFSEFYKDKYTNLRECPHYSEAKGIELALKHLGIHFEYISNVEVDEEPDWNNLRIVGAQVEGVTVWGVGYGAPNEIAEVTAPAGDTIHKYVLLNRPEAQFGYHYNVQTWTSIDGGNSFVYCGDSKFFGTLEEAWDYADDRTCR